MPAAASEELVPDLDGGCDAGAGGSATAPVLVVVGVAACDGPASGRAVCWAFDGAADGTSKVTLCGVGG